MNHGQALKLLARQHDRESSMRCQDFPARAFSHTSTSHSALLGLQYDAFSGSWSIGDGHLTPVTSASILGCSG